MRTEKVQWRGVGTRVLEVQSLEQDGLGGGEKVVYEVSMAEHERLIRIYTVDGKPGLLV